MNYLVLPLFALTLILTTHNLDAICKSPTQGPQGGFATNYIDSYSDIIQPLNFTTPVNILFPSNSLTPKGITKSPSNDAFTVQQPGVYLIAFSINVTTINQFSFINSIALLLNINGTPVQPSPIAESHSVVNSAAAFLELSGQTLLTLSAGDVITLEAVGDFTPNIDIMRIDSALFTVIQIADAP